MTTPPEQLKKNPADDSLMDCFLSPEAAKVEREKRLEHAKNREQFFSEIVSPEQPNAAPQAPCSPLVSSSGPDASLDSTNGIGLLGAATPDESTQATQPVGAAPCPKCGAWPEDNCPGVPKDCPQQERHQSAPDPQEATPRTDAFMFVGDAGWLEPTEAEYERLAEHARSLEREAAALRRRVQELEAQLAAIKESETVAWLMEGNYGKFVFRHNAIADYLAIDPASTVTEIIRRPK